MGDSVCAICCDSLGDNPIVCSYCAFESCETCMGRYITGHFKEPSCMSCNKIWSREFVMEKADRKWVRGTFLPHMGRVLLEQEKGLLPDAQSEAVVVSEIRKLSVQVKMLPTNDKLEKKFRSQPVELEARLEEKRATRNNLLAEIAELKEHSRLYSQTDMESAASTSKGVSYIFKCPHSSCRGFVSTDYKCGTCHGEVCKHCHVALDGASKHKCKKEDKQTAAMVLNETKPCPKCMTLIYKSSGCNQMFCTQCHTAFDWVTGEIERGIIHNPHYYQLLADNQIQAQNVELVACGEIPNVYMFQTHLRRLFKNNYDHDRLLLGMYRLSQHVRHAVLPNYQIDRVKDNFDLRVSYLLDEIDEDTWAMKLMNREKKRMKIIACRDLLQMVMTVMEDLVRQVCFGSMSGMAIVRQYERLTSYYSDALDRITRVHGGSIPRDMRLE